MAFRELIGRDDARFTVEFGNWPKRIVAGESAVARLGEVVGRSGGERAMVVCGSTVAGGEMIARVRDGLGARYAGTFPEVRAHTPIGMVERAVARFRALGADALVSVGGGSAIDAGKAIAVMLAGHADLTPFTIRYDGGEGMSRQPIPGRLVPHVAVPTTAGSASDVMPTGAVHDPASGRKLLFWDDKLVCDATVLDPWMASHAGPELSAATGMTAVARCVESFYSRHRHPISVGLSLHALRLMHRALPRAVAAPDDLAARAACQMACTMAGMAAINAMVSLVHAIGHVVGGKYALQHGISHAILLAPAMHRLLPAAGEEQRLLLDALGGDGRAVSPDAAGREAAERIASLHAGLPLPRRLRDVGVEESELEDMASQTMRDYMMANLPSPVDRDGVLALLREVW